MHEKCGTSTSMSNINNEKCLINFKKCILNQNNLTINIDNSSNSFVDHIKTIHPIVKISRLGNGFSFLKTLEDAIAENNDDDIIYFVENDYLHLPNIDDYLYDGFSTGSNLVTLYDHLDKYTSYHSLTSKIFLGKLCHWRTTPSTCMTFAANVKTLKKHKSVFYKHASYPLQPHDHNMFINLWEVGEILVSPIPGRCTHGERAHLSPLIDWNILMNKIA